MSLRRRFSKCLSVKESRNCYDELHYTDNNQHVENSHKFLTSNQIMSIITATDNIAATIEKNNLLPEDVYEEMYVTFANLLVTDPYISKLLSDKSYVFDFMPFESIKAVYEQPKLSTIPSDTPHIHLAINRMQFSPFNSCSKLGEIGMTLAYEAPMHQISTYKLASYLSSMLAVRTFRCVDRTARVMASSADFTYNTSKFSTFVQQNITLNFEIAHRM